ncbi:hypothetical protein MMC30_008812 [Trapelia coarctata]|nr:hypothetical protein [Trapelia coarctata]
MASFLLQCNICPKHPHFSDLSHLLTHVGSKGHLSHYFKAQVRSRQEPAVREQLRVYDHWYQVNQVEKLLSQRMILKDSKNAQNKGRAIDKSQVTQRPRSTARRAPDDEIHTAQQQAPRRDESVLDPQLTSETFAAPQASAIPKSQASAFDPASASREYIPRMQGSNPTSQKRKAVSPATTPEARPGSHTAPRARLSDVAEAAEAESSLESPARHVYPEPPVFSQPFDAFTHDTSRSTAASHATKKDAVYQSDTEVGEIEELDEIISECTKLKGICWPGMDIFDSASPGARRKRNQKKDGSILEQMKANSAVVEPTELIFYSGGQLKKRRYITGQVESSPIKEESPKPKRQRTRSKKAPLSNVCANVSRSRRELHFTKSTSTNPEPLSKAFQEVSKHSFALDDSLPITEPDAKHRRLRTQTDDELDWALLIGDAQHGKRRAFEVHNEEPEKRQHLSQQRAQNPSPTARYPFLQDKHNATQVYPPPHGLPYPSSGYGLPNLTMTSPAQARVEPVHRKNHETRVGGNRSLFEFSTIDNKENIEPIMDDAGRIDNAAAAFVNGRSTQRYFALQGNGPPHYYTSMPPHLDFAALQPPQPQGFSLNPLALSFGQPPATSMPYNPWCRMRPAVYAGKPGRRPSNTRGLPPGLGEDSGDETIDEEAEQDSMLQDEGDD